MGNRMEKVIIIGAGPAGLTAAYELLSASKKYNVVILEESNTVGGISRTVNHRGNRMDIGGHRFFSKDERVMRWWQDILPIQGKPSYDDRILERMKPLSVDGPDPENEDRVMLIRDRVSRIYYMKKFFDYPVSLKLQTIQNLGFFHTVRAVFSYIFSVLFKLPETCLENFYINRFGKVLYQMFFEGYTEKLWGRHPRNISADWGSQRVKGLSILAILKNMFEKIVPQKNNQHVETSLIEQFQYPKFGPGQLWETVADKITQMGGILKKGCQVVSFTLEQNKITTVTYVENGVEKTEEGDIIISSMPVKDLIAGIPKNWAPSDVREIAEGLPYRDFVTVGLLTEEINLKNETKIKTLGDIVPDCWIYVQDTQVKLGRIQIFNNWSPYMVKDPVHTVWMGLEFFCEEGDDFWNMPEEECISFATSELIQMGIISKGTAILDAHREKVKKAYPAYFDTYDQMDRVVEYLDTIGNLYCIGRNGQHRYNNMDHSMVTAFEAVKDIVENIPDKKNIWNVNTEKEYHEEKN